MKHEKIDEQKLKEVENFYKNRVKGWMISDLKRSIDAKTNLLTALGCLIYTEVIGILLPPLKNETGSIKERRFYRCLFRFPSKEYLLRLDKFLITQTRKGIYKQFRHNMAHRYFPAVIKRQKGVVLFIPSVIARDGFIRDPMGTKIGDAPPIFLDKQNRVTLATKNYANELEKAVSNFYEFTFVKKDPNFQKAAIEGIDIILRGK